MDTPQRYPLFWPAGWPRTRFRADAQFGTMKEAAGQTHRSRRAITTAEATKRLQDELDRMSAKEALLSTNQEVTLAGVPRADRGEPTDPGAAVYFKLEGKDVALACDKWRRLADNIAALAKHIEAMRGMERWGVGTREQLFTGFLALPAPEQWWNVLGVKRNANKQQIDAAYRAKAMSAHPDKPGGSEAAMSRINSAYERAQQEPNYA